MDDLSQLIIERLKGRACRVCGRRLTNPKSIVEGVGPICKKHSKITRTELWDHVHEREKEIHTAYELAELSKLYSPWTTWTIHQ